MKKTAKGFGCLVLFALPFAVAGLFVGFLAARMLWLWNEVRDWQEVPARIVGAELITNTDDDSTTYRVDARYLYEFRGATYEGERVGLSTGADNIGSFHRDKHEELARYRAAGEPFRCYVDPDDPSNAVLYRELRWGLLALMTLFSILFTGVGVGMILAGSVGRRRLQEEQQRTLDHPQEPWRWNDEWTEGRITASGKAQFLLPAIMATLWNLVSVPLLFVIPREVVDQGNRLALVGLIFPLVGLGLAIWALRAFIRWRRYGDSVFEMSTVPGVVGGSLSGRVLTSVDLKPTAGFRITLSCVRRVTRGSGDSRRTSETVLWQSERHLERESAEFDPTRSEVPIHFHIPFEASPSEERSDNDKILWRLEIEAAVPGVDYRSQFEVPVFRTADSRPEPSPDDASDGWGIESEPTIRWVDYGIESELLSTGARRLSFRAARHKVAALALTGFLLVWLGFNSLLFFLDAPLFFSLVWGAFSLLIAFGVLDLWFERRQIEIHSDRLVLKGGLFGLGPSREIPRSEIREIQPVRGMQSGNKLYYRIQINTLAGRKQIAATKLDNLSLARAVIDQIS